MLLSLTLLSVLQLAPADTISGRWQITGDVVGNPLDQVCTFQQSGSALTGSCAAAGGSAIALTGEVKENTITFQHGGEYDGQPLTIIYTGSLENPSEIRGTVLVQPFDVSGVFAAKPAPPAEEQ